MKRQPESQLVLWQGGSCILCPAGVECQNEVCLSSRGQTACCTCVDWDSKGACVIWVSPQGLREPQCNFEVDEPVMYGSLQIWIQKIFILAIVTKIGLELTVFLCTGIQKCR